MASNKPPMLVNQRYLLREQIGTGGMGAVFRVTDRLNGMDVALKQVTIPPDQLMYSSRSSETDLNLSLAQEFKTMASLRHPNIISVLDYGFNVEGQPYFTMDLLENAQTLVEAGRDQPLEEQVDLLVQTLLALAYLHRRGVLHRDLKPGNVMVVNGQVKLLDFGVSVITARSTANVNASSGGTLAYMAPELFRGEPASHGSDFYAVGVMAFELFAGRFPYDLDNIALMLNQIVSLPVDMSPLHQGAPLVAVLEKLLAKTREARYRTANEVIQALCEAADHPMPPETTEIRESFLQAAKFVGREAEMSQLEEVLTEAITGRGSTWLVAEESGVGKSRLCNELRTLALVEGAQVLYGQSISEGGSPYSLWREALRWLVLGADLPNEQASVLKALVPDIGELLGKEVPDAPPLDPQAEQQRLLRTTTSVFKRQTQPVLVILEDLQWTGSTSLKLLNWLKTYLVDASVLFLGNYRDDERPDLPDELPGVNLLKLERLTEKETADLSASMLGAAGRESQVVQLLQRETEGNPFFLVETVRVLAEEAGQLDRIGELALPVKVFARGIQEIVQWRLARLPAAAQPLLQVAAVTGRELDLKLLQSIDAKTDLEAWLRICAEAAVLEIGGTIWRFAHDKLREHILDELPADRRTQLHKQVAEALESLYPDAPRYITALAYHWAAAGDADKELAYAEAAAHQAAQNSANEEAIRFFNRALELLLAQPETAGRARRELAMLIGLGPPLMTARGFGASEVAYTYDRAQELAAQTGQSDMLFHATWGQWKHYTQVNDANTSQRLLERLFQLAEQFEDDGFLLEAHHSGWITKSVYNDAAAALEHAKKGIAIYQPEVHQNHIQLYGHDPGVCALCYSALSLWKLGYPDQAYHQVTKGFELGEEIGHPFSLEVGRWGMYWVYYLRGELAEASEKVQEAIQFAGEHGFPQLFASALLVQGAILVRNGKGEEGFKKIREGEKLRERIGSIPEIHPEFLEACLAIGAIEEGLRAGEQEQKAHSFTGKRWVDPEIPRLYGELTLAQDPYRASEAEAQFQLAIEIAQRRSVRSLELRAVMSLARLWQKQGRAAEAYKRLSEVYNWFTEGFDTADLQEAKALLGELG